MGLILGGMGISIYGGLNNDMDLINAGIELAVAPFGFIFGERLVLSYRGSAK